MGDPGLASKYIAEQIEDSERAQFDRERFQTSQLAPVEIERRESLRLSISRVEQQLERATHPKLKRMLNKALRDLKAER